MDKQIFSCFTLFLLVFFLLLLFVSYSFSLYLKPLHRHCTPPSKYHNPKSHHSDQREGWFSSLFDPPTSPLKPRPGRLEPCCASVSLGASGPSRPLSHDLNPLSATPLLPQLTPVPPPTQYMLPCATSHVTPCSLFL